MNRPNLLLILLIVSVALNGALLGATARDWFAGDDYAAGAEHGERRGERSGRPPTPGMTGVGFNLRGFLSALPDDERSRAREYMRVERQTVRGLMRDAAEARVNARQALLAENLDEEAVLAAFSEARSTRAAIEAHTTGIMLHLLETMTQEEREAALTAALGPDRMGRRGRRGPGGPGFDGPPPRGGPPPHHREFGPHDAPPADDADADREPPEQE
jgi:uncharacterized membrane protein